MPCRSRSVLVLALASTPLLQDAAPPALAKLLEDLGSKSFPTRRDAVKACRGRVEPAIGDKLLEVAEKDAHPNIRAWAIDELARRDDRRVRPLLLRAIESESNPFPRERALAAFGARQEEGAFDLLSRYLEGRQAAAAIEGLGRLGDARAFEPVLALLERRRSEWQISAQAPRALLALDGKRGRAELLRIFRTASDFTGLGDIASALREHPDDTVRDAMLATLDETKDVLRAHWAVQVLGAFRDPNTNKRLRVVFEQRQDVRAVCAEALAATGDRGSAVFLASFLANERDVATRRAMLEALGTLGEASVVAQVAAGLEHETDDLCAVLALAALGRLGDRRAIAAAMARIDDPAVTAQDARLSSIRRFPWNARVGDVAVWAAATLRDGQPPFALERLSQFPQRAPSEEVDKLRADLAQWWRQLGDRDKGPFSLPGK